MYFVVACCEEYILKCVSNLNSGIEAELNAWADQYPKAWLAVDLRDGVIPPSTVRPLNDVLMGLKRPVIVIVSRSPEHEEWPQWVLPA